MIHKLSNTVQGTARVPGVLGVLILALVLGSMTGAGAGEKMTAEEWYEKVQSTPQLRQFDGNGTLYVFYDSQCPYCHQLFDMIQKNRDVFVEENVAVGWIPVGILSRKSMGQAQAHLKRGWPELKRHFEGEESEEINQSRFREQLKRNNGLFDAAGERAGTPLLVLRTERGVRIFGGLPKNGDQLTQIVKAVQ